MTNELNQKGLPDQRSFAPRWSQRLRDLGIHLSYALEGWEKVPRPQPRVVACVVGGAWTLFEGPPELLVDLLRVIGVDGD